MNFGMLGEENVSDGHRARCPSASQLLERQGSMIRKMGKALPIVAIICISVALTAAQEKKPSQKDEKEPATSTLRIEVTGGEKNEGIDGASVYVRYVHERPLLKDKKVEMNVKTNREGVAKIPLVPRGKILVQVIASGWKTFGRWYDVTEEEQTVKIKLDRPTRWY